MFLRIRIVQPVFINHFSLQRANSYCELKKDKRIDYGMAVRISVRPMPGLQRRLPACMKDKKKANKQASYSATKFDEVYKLEDVLSKCPGRSGLLAE